MPYRINDMPFAYRALVGILGTGIAMSFWQALGDTRPVDPADWIIRIVVALLVLGTFTVAVIGYFRGMSALDEFRKDINEKHATNTHNMTVMFEAVEGVLRSLFQADNKAQQQITHDFTEFKKRLK